ncbi:hypothetical protein BGZ63DRAFT_456831 [Mariannaea sp. PMI_226]|nr:hypothetical protein BGZ63DRAFT_456831 [Mariannaea sp. PMI_226]
MSVSPPPMLHPDAKPLVSLLSRSLSSFQASQDVFRVLHTLPSSSAAAGAASSSNPAPRRPTRPVRNLIVLDSSFNPPTIAHAGMARDALRAVRGKGEARLMLLLSVNNADKAPKPASFPLRLGMMEAMGRALLDELRENGELEIDVAVTTMPFFHEKARAIAQSGFYGSSSTSSSPSSTTQTFLAGFDTLVRIFNPKYYHPSGIRAALDPFFETARLRVTTRPDEQWGGTDKQGEEVERLANGGLEEVGGRGEWMSRVDMVEGGREGEGVSSSRARDMVKCGEKGLDGLVVGEVRAWIDSHELYRD